ncbi:MAG: BREX-1 system adenine-specific DNA-methyltransferase PglX [Acidimicrobiaceae bacterium]|nr:BREX-1 system adenine-specific DNA-methyltransferase PglX [Acidimicrobiaceae bacterium]
MSEALTADGRSRLERLVGRARERLDQDLAIQASGRFGIDSDGSIADETDLRLDLGGLTDRREIVDVVRFLESEGRSPAEAVARLIREAVFTHLNRLVAIRIAEELGILPPSLAEGERSQGYLEVRELAPLLASDDTNGYWSYLMLCGDELAGDVPNLFDARNPLLTLAPSPAALRDLVTLFADPECCDLWTASDCLGWAYQFFNTAQDRRRARYRDDGSPKAPETSEDLAVRNQFFTPRYVVDFLVQNSLGRRLIDADPQSRLLDDLPLLVDPPTEPGLPVDLAEVSVLDPACGSGHFLLGAYDLLEKAWSHAGVDPGDAAPSILGSLWGIDIDLRCVQVASAVLLLRARRVCPRGELPRPNIICARALPASATGFDELIERLDPTQRALLRSLTELLEQAPVLGPLLRLEDPIEEVIRGSIAGSPGGALARAVDPGTIVRLRDELLKELGTFAASTTATPAERLLVAEADDAVRFVMALLHRYDTVLQNPPFGDPVPDTRPYLKAAYPWIPSRNHNLLAAFVGRSLELCKPAAGYVGAITSRSGLFLKTFESWRKQVLLGHRLVTLADLGDRVMEQAGVEAAAYVVGASPAETDDSATLIRLLRDTNRPAGLAAATGAHRAELHDDRVFRVALSDLKAVPGWPVAYWMGAPLRRLFADHPALEGRGAEVRQGLATGDDFRFVRAFWEVDPSRIARSRDETKTGRRWAPFAKGGQYSPYWADIHLVVDWKDDGEHIRADEGSVLRNTQYYFRPGLTWPRRTNSGLGIRLLPAGAAFADKGPAVFPQADPLAVLGWLKSRLIQACIDVMVAAGEEVSGGVPRSYEVGLLKRLPWIDRVGSDSETSSAVAAIASLRRRADTRDETCRAFTTPAVMPALLDGRELTEAAECAADSLGAEHLRVIEISHQLDRRTHSLAELDADMEAYLDSEVGPHPASYPAGPLDEDELRRLLSEPIRNVIGEITEQRNGGTRAVVKQSYLADRRLEVISHGLQRPPAQIEAFRRERRVLPHSEPSASAASVLSYLIGLAFGRWDWRAAGVSDPEMGGLFDPVPVHPPGMLLDDGRPARTAPAGYELALPPEQILLDQPGHTWDIGERVTAAASLLVEEADRLLDELMSHLDGRDLRHQMRRHFFKEHLARYSKSRRKAPIYWPLYIPSGAWGVWVYAPSLRRETLYAIEAAASARLQAAHVETKRLTRTLSEDATGRSAREAADALESEQRLSEELTTFQRKTERVAALGWEPDLDDGIVLCAAPLADLFPGWPEAAKQRENIRAGKYPWASVSQWRVEL